MKTKIFQVLIFCVCVFAILKFVINDPEKETAASNQAPVENVETTNHESSKNTTTTSTVENKSNEVKEETEEENKSKLTGRKGELDSSIRNIVKDFNGVSVKDIEINEHMGTERKDDYITLVRLSYDNPNEAKTSRKLIGLYNNDLGARIADEGDITKLVIFWEVPYLQEGKNSAKAILELKNNNMVFDTNWYDPNVY
ncbi:MAG TPA: hypothetical protein VNU45_05400 [Rummeliibacillus sp.]|nr:hypothetical protein [Rummeliibacillus sp.]